MDNKEKLKMDLLDFIDTRLEESYQIVSKRKEYKTKYKKCEEEKQELLNQLSKEQQQQYHKLQDNQMYLDTLELEEAYKTGVKDTINILKSEV